MPKVYLAIPEILQILVLVSPFFLKAHVYWNISNPNINCCIPSYSHLNKVIYSHLSKVMEGRKLREEGLTQFGTGRITHPQHVSGLFT